MVVERLPAGEDEPGHGHGKVASRDRGEGETQEEIRASWAEGYQRVTHEVHRVAATVSAARVVDDHTVVAGERGMWPLEDAVVAVGERHPTPLSMDPGLVEGRLLARHIPPAKSAILGSDKGLSEFRPRDRVSKPAGCERDPIELPSCESGRVDGVPALEEFPEVARAECEEVVESHRRIIAGGEIS
jgi:hypothetical protein